MFGYTQSPGGIRRGNIWQGSGGIITPAYKWEYGLYAAYPYSSTSANSVTGFFCGDERYSDSSIFRNSVYILSPEFNEIEYVSEDKHQEMLCSVDFFRGCDNVNVKAKPYHVRLSSYSLYQDSCAVYSTQKTLAAPFPYRFFGYIDRGASYIDQSNYSESDVRAKYSEIKSKVNRQLSEFKPAIGKAAHSIDVIGQNEIYTAQAADFSTLSKIETVPIYNSTNSFGQYNAMMYDCHILNSYQMILCVGFLRCRQQAAYRSFYKNEKDRMHFPLVQCIPPYLKKDGVYFPKMSARINFTNGPYYDYTFEYTPTEKQDPAPYNIKDLSSVSSDYNNYMEYIIDSNIQSIPVDYVMVMVEYNTMCWYGIHGILQPFVNAV